MPLYRVTNNQNSQFTVPPPVARTLRPRGFVDVVLDSGALEVPPLSTLIESRAISVAERADATPAEVTTTDATVTTAATVAIPTNKLVQVTAKGLARNVAGSEGASYVLVGTFRNDAGVVTQIGATTALVNHEDVIGWAFALAVSGTNVAINVTGEAAKTIRWDVSYTLVAVD